MGSRYCLITLLEESLMELILQSKNITFAQTHSNCPRKKKTLMRALQLKQDTCCPHSPCATVLSLWGDVLSLRVLKSRGCFRRLVQNRNTIEGLIGERGGVFAWFQMSEDGRFWEGLADGKLNGFAHATAVCGSLEPSLAS